MINKYCQKNKNKQVIMTNEYIDLSTTFSHKRNEEIKNQGYFGVVMF
jgi:hypothetical protein